MEIIRHGFYGNTLRCTVELNEDEDGIDAELTTYHMCNLIRDEYLVSDQYYGSYIEYGKSYIIEDLELIKYSLNIGGNTVQAKSIKELNILISEDKLDELIDKLINPIKIDLEDA